MLTSSRHPGAFRQIYDAVALIAVVNVVVGAALATYALGTGKVTIRQIRSAVAALRGAPLSSEHPVVCQPASSVPSDGDNEAFPLANVDPRSATDLEIARLEAQRIKVELEQRTALANAVLLKVRSEREALQKDRNDAKQASEITAEESRKKAIQRQVQIFDSLSPKTAMQHLLAMPDVEEAARILAALDSDKSKKIIEAAKRGSDLTRMQAVLQKVREVAPTAEVIAAGRESQEEER